MQLRPLGRSGLMVPPIVFGANVFGWTADRATSFRLLDALADAGFTAIDTADRYSAWVPGHQGGESETVIGEWLAARPGARAGTIIATKVGMEMGSGDKGLSPAWIRRAADASLKRLGTDRIDFYQAHIDDPTVPLADTLGAFQELIAAGKVRAIGASNYTAPRLAEALAVSARHNLPRFEALQPLYNLMERPAFEADLQAVCTANGLGVIPYYALAAGFLSGKYRSEADLGQSPRGGGVKKYLNEKGHRVLAALDAAAAELGATQAQVAVAWMIAKPAITAPIASASRIEQLGPLLKAADLVLPAATMAALDAASA